MRPWLGFALFVVTAALSRTAAADEPPAAESAALDWVRLESATSCPSAAEVTSAIEQRLGHSALVPKEQATLRIEAKLEGLPSGEFQIEIVLVRGESVVGRRELESEDGSCRSVIALTIDPEASLDPLPIPEAPKPEAEKAPPPSAERKAPSRDSPPPAPSRKMPWQTDLELGGGVATGMLPKAAAVVFARGRVLPPRWPLGIELEGAYFPPVQVVTEPGKGSDFSAYYLGAGLCSRPSRARRFGWSACGDVEIGAIRGQGYGFDSTTTFGTLTAALAARGALWFRFLKPLAAVVGPSIIIPLKRDYFETETADGTEPLFRMSAIGATFNLGVVLEL
jgi:hypothetical protein